MVADVPSTLTSGLRLIQSLTACLLVLVRFQVRAQATLGASEKPSVDGQDFQIHTVLAQLHFSQIQL